FIFILNICICIGNAQPGNFFIKHGNNIPAVTCSSVIFAPLTDMYFRSAGAGAVWVKKQIDLQQSFDITFFASFKDTTAVDGAAFVLQPDSNSLGGDDNGLGYKEIKNSIAVTFDAFQNSADHDPLFDHAAIQSNGDIDHNSTNNLAGPVSIESYYAIQINPGYSPGKTFAHSINVKWDPVTMNFTVYIDGSLLMAVKKDLIQTIFNGDPIVYWGFTGSNTQKKRYEPGSDLDLGSFEFFAGDEINPRFDTQPSLDTCFGTPVTFVDRSIYGLDSVFNALALNKWYWDFGDGSISILRYPPPHTYTASGTYTVRYAIANQLGCTLDTVIRKITLGAKPAANFSYSAGCVSTPVTFTDLSSAKDNLVVAWKWNFDNAYTSESRDPVVSFNTEGTKNISLTVGTNYGCVSDTTLSIIVTGKPSMDFSFSQNCDGLVNYAGILLNSVQPQKWLWQFGDNRQSGIRNPAHQFIANGHYYTLLLAFSDAGCPSDSITKTITIDKLYPFAGNDTTIAAGQPLQLEAIGGVSYKWTPANDLNDAFIKNPIAILTKNQNLIVIVHNAEGCETSDTINIKVYKDADLYMPNAFTPNNDGNNDIFRITAPGIASINYFNIYNRWGKMIYTSTDIKKGWDGTLNGRLQENGTYIWIIKAIDYKGIVIEKKGTLLLIR
ncbi:MAG: PKD domain-containing protein, partial [Bacteroidota bacterium]